MECDPAARARYASLLARQRAPYRGRIGAMTAILQQVSDSLSTLAANASPYIVRIEARRRLPATGIVWSPEGLIVTAHHVIERESPIQVGLADGRSVEAT